MKKLLIVALICSSNIYAQKEPVGTEGIQTIIDLFQKKPIVAIGETHGHLQLYQFLTKLVQTEGFYKNVNDILIESGNALYQETLDEYISGKDVEFSDLQKVWLNTTQSPVDPWSIDVYYNFLKTIRELNNLIPKNYRIRIIAADSSISWKNINTKEDYLKERGSREEFYAKIAINEVLSKNHKALLINGGAHFGDHRVTTVNQRIEKVYPKSITVILAKSGLWKGNESIEEKLNWSIGTIAKVKDNWIGLLPGPRRIAIVTPTNNNSKKLSSTSNAPTSVSIQKPIGSPSKYKRQDYFDYILYLGTSKDLKYGNIDASIYTSDKLWKELNRRSMIRFNHKLIEDSRKTGKLRPEAYN
ncbi:hypothetical protein [uncultured Lutibacter sp.]|uniref:hypothetical protein n=1 Tax=uncultured Lutibacter sp. TaxID=437739 RepID=UPI002637B05D|nr:hypothetical protein [uncultured Lutibacter sp.]